MDPDLERHARSVRAKRDVIALRIHDAFFLALFLPHDVAKNAALFFAEPFARRAQLVENPPRHKSGRGNLRMRMRPFRAGQRAAIFKHGDVFEPRIALQIGDAHGVSIEDGVEFRHRSCSLMVRPCSGVSMTISCAPTGSMRS